MQNHKLFTLLQVLSPAEWDGLKKYHLLHAQKGSDVNKLFLYCRKNADRLKNDQLTIEDIKSKALVDNSHKSVLNALSKLKLIVEEYLIHYDLINDKDAKEFCLLYTSPSPRDRTRSRMPSSA